METIKTFFMLTGEEKKQLKSKYFQVTPDICICDGLVVVLNSEGTVSVEGNQTFDSHKWINVIKICSGDHHVVGLKSDGTVVAFGDNTYNQCNVSSWKNIANISAKNDLTVGISANGQTYTTGSFEKHTFDMDNVKKIYQTIGSVVQEYETKISDLKKELNSVKESSKIFKADVVNSISDFKPKINALENAVKALPDSENLLHFADEFEYIIKNSDITLLHYMGSKVRTIKFPSNIGGKSVTNVAEGIFDFIDNNAVKEIYISGSIVTINKENRVFKKLVNLNGINVNKNNISYSSHDGVLFNKAKTELITYPKAKFGDYSIPKGVVSIKDEAFLNCHNLRSIIIPDSIKNLYPYNASDDNDVFYCPWGEDLGSCKNLENISVAEDNLYFSSDSDGVLFDKQKHILICCPSKKKGYYSVPNHVVKIQDGAFSNCPDMKGVFIPDSVGQIGSCAFGIGNPPTSIEIWGNPNSFAFEYAKRLNIKFINKNQNSSLFSRCFGGSK